MTATLAQTKKWRKIWRTSPAHNRAVTHQRARVQVPGRNHDNTGTGAEAVNCSGQGLGHGSAARDSIVSDLSLLATAPAHDGAAEQQGAGVVLAGSNVSGGGGQVGHGHWDGVGAGGVQES